MAKRRFEYEIEVLDKFAANLQRFRTDLEATRQFVRSFRADIQGLRRTTDNLKRANIGFGKSFSAFNKNTAKFKTQSKERRQVLRDETAAVLRFGRALRDVSAQKPNIFGNIRKEAARLIVSLRTIIRLIKEIRSGLTFPGARANSIARSLSGISQQQAALAGATTRTTSATTKQKKSLEDIGGTANRISFTFRRLFGILAAFTLARKGLEAVGVGIRSLVTSNIEIERSEIALIGIITATTTSINGQTSALGRYQEATKIATQLQVALRIAALTTSASFEELSRAIEVALGPALAEGFSLPQIVEFTTRISQAADAVGLAQNQLAEEVRSLFLGTITPKNTRIATLLQITPADIRRAKASGELFDFLSKKFEAFALTSGRTLNTFNSKLTNTIGKLKLLAAEGGKGFFNQLKSLIDQIADSVAIIDLKELSITFNPKLLATVATFADSLSFAVVQLQTLFSEISVDEFSASILVITSSIKAAASIVKEVIHGILLGINDISKAVLIVRAEVEKFLEEKGITGIDQKLKDIVRTALRAFTIFIGISTATAVVKGVLSIVLGTLKFIPATLLTIFKSIRAIASVGASILTNTLFFTGLILKNLALIVVQLSRIIAKLTIALGKTLLFLTPILLIPAIIVGAIAGIQLLLDKIFDIRITASDLLDVLVSMISRWVVIVLGKITVLFSKIKNNSVSLFSFIFDLFTTHVLTPTLNAISDLIRQVGRGLRASNFLGLGFINDIANSLENIDLGKLSTTANDVLKKISEAAQQNIKDTEKSVNLLIATADEGLQKAIDDALGRSDDAKNIVAEIVDVARAALESLQPEIAKLAASLKSAGSGFGRAFNIVGGGILENIKDVLSSLLPSVIAGLSVISSKFAGLNGLLKVTEKVIKGFGKDIPNLEGDVLGFLKKLRERLSDIVNRFSQEMEAVVDIILSAIDQVSDAASEIIIEVFSGTTSKKIREIIGNLFRSLAQQILKELIQLALAKALFRILNSPRLGGTGGVTGGEIPKKATPSLSHLAAGGMALGGFLSQFKRPRNLDPRDTVPIWAQPGEFMIRKSSVDRYGIPFLEALNRGLIDPTIALLNRGKPSLSRFQSPAQMPVGKASGGEIPLFQPPAQRQQATPQVVAAITVADKKTMKALLRNGGSVLLDFLRENRVSIGA